MGGTIGLPRGFRLSPFMIFNSGAPYNVTVGQDLTNDWQYNARPAFAASVSGSRPSLTQACHYTISPTTAYTQIPINYLTGPSNFTLNLRLAKTFGFGPVVGGKNTAQKLVAPAAVLLPAVVRAAAVAWAWDAAGPAASEAWVPPPIDATT